MPKRKPELLLEDILEAMEKISGYTADTEFEQFATDIRTIDAVIRNLEIIGEAARQLPEEFREKHSHISWYQIIGIRNRIIHEYFGVDLTIIWQVVQHDLERFKEEIRQLCN